MKTLSEEMRIGREGTERERYEGSGPGPQLQGPGHPGGHSGSFSGEARKTESKTQDSAQALRSFRQVCFSKSQHWLFWKVYKMQINKKKIKGRCSPRDNH